MEHNHRFGYKEKLKGRKPIENLFKNGQSFNLFPLKITYTKTCLPESTPQIKVGVGAGKRHFKRAHDRNRIKRLIRESYRLNKQPFLHFLEQHNISITIFFMYISKELPSFELLNNKLPQALDQLKNRLHEAPETID